MPKRLLQLRLFAAHLGFAWGLLAATVARAAPVQFDLPAQSGATALAGFAKQAGVEVLFSFADLKAVTTNAVKGAHEPDAALALLLRGTGFGFTRNSSGKFVIVREARRSARGEIRGVVVSAATNEPLADAVVRLDGTNWGVRTRADGTFLLHELEPGAHVLHVAASGKVPLQIADAIVDGGRRTELGTLRLAAAPDGAEQLAEMVVNADALNAISAPTLLALQAMIVTPSRWGVEEERGPIAATLTESDLLALPQLGEDLYRAISHLPGLAVDDLTARFWVRGAPHDQVLARLDGVELIEPFHLKDTDSSLSILDLETISRLDLYTGGFSAEFGDRSAGVLTMESDSYARAKPRTTLGLSLTGGHAANRGQTRDGRSRWLVAARSGYPDIALKSVDSNTNDSEIRPRYHDFMAKWEMNLTPDQVVSLHALHAGDRMFFRDSDGAVLTSRYGSDYFWARWRGTFGATSGEAVLSHTRVTWQRDGDGVLDELFTLNLHEKRTLAANAVRSDWSHAAGERLLWRFGAEARTGDADYQYRGRRDVLVLRNAAFQVERRENQLGAAPSGTALGGYATVRLQATPEITVEPGLRYDRNNYAGDSDVSPRFNLAWHRGQTTWRAAWGFYAQAQALHQLAVPDGDARFRPAERAEHRIVSVEHRLRSGIDLRLEAYERLVTHPRPRWENVVDTASALPELDTDRARLDPTRQQARGVELIIERRGAKKITWSASYAFARAEETLADGVTVPRARDQRHTWHVDLTYTPTPRWQFSLAGQYHTGWPTTGLDWSAVRLANGGTAIVSTFGPIYALRLPAYERIDFRAQRRFELRHGTLRVFFDAFNLTNRRNIINFNYDVNLVSGTTVQVRRHNGESMFPLLPSVGLTWDF